MANNQLPPEVPVLSSGEIADKFEAVPRLLLAGAVDQANSDIMLLSNQPNVTMSDILNLAVRAKQVVAEALKAEKEKDATSPRLDSLYQADKLTADLLEWAGSSEYGDDRE